MSDILNVSINGQICTGGRICLYTIEKWMKEDNVKRYESANSSFTDEMLDECLMIDYISSDEKRTE